jgi:predicted nuclease of predicted toxin-antitoxin system
MKLLFDQNLAPSLVGHLRDLFPGSAHVSQCGLGEASDIAMWEYARDNDFTLVSKDADFVELSTLRGAPPKVVWLRLGNCVTRDIHDAIRSNSIAIAELSRDRERGVLALLRKAQR